MAQTTVSSEPVVAGQRPKLSLKNELAESSSPYLRAHKNNPVAWQEWSTKTVNLAKEHERLIFLSIGYHACHWCHVMEKESFSSPEVATILNESFIPIKVDRESRPDLDDTYMSYVTATTGSGGWPLNVFLTPTLQPVFGGTYWPGSTSVTSINSEAEERPLTFLDILCKMEEVWRNEKDRCLKSAADITRQLQAFAAEGIFSHSTVHVRGVGENDPLEPLDLDLIDDALDHFIAKYDTKHGGFVQSVQGPKFATPPNLTYLLRIGASINQPVTHTRFGFPPPIPAILGKKACVTATSMAMHTLLSMSRSALRDQLGHGFHRYSVTRDWNLPHFEKMTCDNAQLLSAYCDAWALGRDPEILGTIYDLVEYFTGSESAIIGPHGGWFTSEDADSIPELTSSSKPDVHAEKKEGAYYVWTSRELISILGERDAAILSRHFGVKEHGNVPAAHDVYDDFLSQNVLFIDATPSVLAKEFGLKEQEIVQIVKDGRNKLKEHRTAKRISPEIDDKILVSYNALVISALARAANTLTTIDDTKAKRCKESAINAVSFIKENLFNPKTGKLSRVFSSVSNASIYNDKDMAFVDDYAYLIQALIKVYDISIDQSYLDFAFTLQDTLDKYFYAGAHGGYFQAAKSDFTDDQGIRSPSTAASEQSLSSNVSGQASQQTSEEHLRPIDQILNLKPGTDNSLPSPNGVIAQNLLYLASYASSLDTLPAITSPINSDDASSVPMSTTSRSERFQYQAKKTIDAFAPEIIQHPFLYGTLLGAIVLDAVGIKSLIVPASCSNAEIEARCLRGFGRTVIRLQESSGMGVKPGEVMICTKGMCRLLRDGELDDVGDFVDEEDAINSNNEESGFANLDSGKIDNNAALSGTENQSKPIAE